MPDPRPRASLIYNPNAGRRRHGRSLEAIRAALGTTYDLAVTPTRAPREATRLAREAALRNDTAVFAWGGDGTIREVVEGILGSPTILGVLPGGTFNVVALAIGLPRNPVAAAVALSTGTPKPRDAGLIASTPFLMQATAGLDGFLMRHLRADMKARFGFAGVMIDGLRAWSRYTFPQFEVEVDGQSHTVTGAGFVNLPEYAGPFHFVPDARWDDGQGHVLLYTGRTRLSALLFTIALALGRHHLRRDVRTMAADQLIIRGDPSVCVQTDGDPWLYPLPATCRLAAERIQVLIPA